MIISKVVSKVLPLVLKGVLKAVMPELEPLKKYVYQDNELDKKCEDFEKRIRRLEGTKMPGHNKWYED